MKLTHAMAEQCVYNCIDALPFDITEKNLVDWITQVNTLAFSYQRMSKLPTEVFWSTVCYNPNFFISFDSALECLPKGHSLERYQLVYRWNEGAQKAVEALRFQILVIYCRIHVFPSNIDSAITQTEWIEYTQNRGIMPLMRAAKVWALFPNKVDIFFRIISGHLKIILNPQRNFKDLFVEIKDNFEHSEAAVSQLLAKFSQMRDAQQIKAAGLVRKFLYLVADAIFSTLVTFDVLQGTKMIKDITVILLRIPSLIESIGRSFPVGMLMDVATVIPGWPMRNLLHINAQIEQGAVRLFKKGLEVLTEPKDRFRIIEASLRFPRFLFLVNEFSGLNPFLLSLTAEERRKVDEAVQVACEEQQSVIFKRVEDQGLLQSLGEIDRLPPDRRRALDELKDVFQHMSVPYLHLCLRHFNYNSAYAIESMLSADHNMPMDLRRMEHVQFPRRSRPDFSPSLPTITYKDLEMLENAIKPSRSAPLIPEKREEDQKNIFKGLFSLAPATPTPKLPVPNNEASVPEPCTSTLPELLEALRGSLDRSKIRAKNSLPKPKEQPLQIGPHGERLVHMHEAKRYAGVSKFKTSEEDKTVIRPSYDKFKYETHFEEDDMYDDEYDDGYEQREFQVEPLNEPLPEESEEEEEGEETNKKDGGATRGTARGGGRGGFRGGGGGRGGKVPETQEAGGQGSSVPRGGSNANYTGGRQRQMKERHKNEWKQRGADRKRGKGMF